MVKTILVDMDEVLVDLVESWYQMYHELGGELITKQATLSYNFETSGLVKDLNLFWKALDRAPAMRIAKPIPGALEALKLLCDDERFDVYLVTYARSESWGKAHEAKLAWLWQHAPWFDRDMVIFAKHKWTISGDYLIEDNLQTCIWWAQYQNGTALLVEQPWNKTAMHDAGTYRVRSMEDAVNTILNIEVEV